MRPNNCRRRLLLVLLVLVPATARADDPAGQALDAAGMQAAIDSIRQQARDDYKAFHDLCTKLHDAAPELNKNDVYLPSWPALQQAFGARLNAQFRGIELLPVGEVSFAGEYKPFEMPLGDQKFAVVKDSEVLALYRAYLATGDARELRKGLEALYSKYPPRDRKYALEHHWIWTPASGPEFFEARIARNGGWYGYHVLHLLSHLEYARRNGSVYRCEGESLAAGIARWKRYNGEIRPLIEELLKADLAWAMAGLKSVRAEYANDQAKLALPIERDATGGPTIEGIDRRQKQAEELDRKLVETCKPFVAEAQKCDDAAAAVQKKLLAITSRRISGIEFRPRPGEPRGIGIFVVEEPSRGAARESAYAGVFNVLAASAEAPRKSRVLLIVGQRLPKNSAAVVSVGGDTSRIKYSVMQTKAESANDPRHQREWVRAWESAAGRLDREDRNRLIKLDALLVRADLAHATGGIRELWLESAGGRRYRGTWILDKGDLLASLNFVRPSEPGAKGATRPADHWDPTQLLFLPETARVELAFDVAPEEDSFDLLIGKRSGEKLEFLRQGERAFVKARRQPGDGRVFRTDPILVAAPGDKAGQGADPSVIFLSCRPGECLLAMPADGSLINCRPAVAEAALERAPRTLWIEALQRAGGEERVANWHSIWSLLKGARPLTDDEIGEIASNFLGGYSPTNTKIRLGHAAAMILLRDEFIAMLKSYRQELDRIDDDAKLFGLMRELRPHFAQADFRFGDLLVKSPGSFANPKVPIRRVFDMDWLVENCRMDDRWRNSEAAAKWQREAVKSAWSEYRSAAETALARAEGTRDDDLKGLVQLTGTGFEPVIARLTPRLMKLQEDGSIMRWVPDTVARKWLASIPALADEAQKRKEADQALIGTVGMVFSIPAVLAGGIYGVSMSMALNLATAGEVALDKLPQWFRDRDELVFATGAMELLNSERLDIARLKDRPIWLTCAELGIAGLGVVADAWKAAAEVQSAVAMARARQLLQADEKLVERFKSLSPEEQGAALWAMEHAQALRAARHDLKADELAAERLAQKLEEEAKLRFRQEHTAVDPEFSVDPPFMPRSVARAAGKGEKFIDPLMPQANAVCEVIGGDGRKQSFRLGKLLGRGSFAHVYELLDAEGKSTDEVIKFYQSRGVMCSNTSVVEATGSGARLLRENKIPQLEVRVCDPQARPAVVPGAWREDYEMMMPYVIQKKLDPSKQKLFDFHYLKETRRAPGGAEYEEVVGAVVEGDAFTEAHQRAVARLFRKMADAKLVWEDSHLGNLYFFEGAGGIEAGVLDQDRIIRLGEEVKQEYMEYWMGVFDLKRESFCIDSLLGSPQAGACHMTAEMYWAKLFEYGRRWIVYDREAHQFKPILLNPDIVRQEFGNIYKWVDYDFTAPPEVPAVPAAPPGAAPARPILFPLRRAELRLAA